MAIFRTIFSHILISLWVTLKAHYCLFDVKKMTEQYGLVPDKAEVPKVSVLV